ncbi:MAG: hypothetical protein ACRDNY_08120 [Gaiellaceae bacterium]
MGGIRWERWAPASGIVYVLLFVVGLMVAPKSIGETDEEILAYYADSGNRAREISSFFIGIVAVLFFLFFLRTLHRRLRSVESEPKSLPALAFGAGVTSAALLVGAVALWTGTSFTIEDTSEFVVDPSLARYVDTTGYLLFTASVMVTSLLVGATSLLAVRTAVLPTWLGWVGLPVAVILLFAFFFFPLLVFWLWVLAVSVIFIARPPVTHAAEAGISKGR